LKLEKHLSVSFQNFIWSLGEDSSRGGVAWGYIRNITPRPDKD
jgi:hypothetical protein